MRKIVKRALALTLAGAMVVQPMPGTVGLTTVSAEGIADEFAIPAADANGRVGAEVPYTRYDSMEASIGGGATIKTSPNFDRMNIASQASEQSYVALPSSGSYAEWTMGTTGNGVTMRFTMPDSGSTGLSGSVDVYVNGSKVKTVDLSSYWMWQYFGGGNPSDSNDGGAPAFAFDEVHFMLDKSLQVGDKIRIQSSGASGLEYGVDFLEIEEVEAEIDQPANSVNVQDFGATPDDGTDDYQAILDATSYADANGMDVYIPTGTYHINQIWRLYGSDMKITGAGIWYTNIQFTNSNSGMGGVSGGWDSVNGSSKDGYAQNIEFCNMYLNSNLSSRYSQQAVYKCFMDVFTNGSVIHDIWEDHFECGFWFGDYNGNMHYSDGVKVVDCRIRNNLADGVNFCQGTSNATVYNCSVRNNGDDGLAMWNDSTMSAKDESNNVFAYNTIDFIWRAGGIAVYGGTGHKIYNNYICDTFLASGIHLNTTFPGHKFAGTSPIVFENNIMVRCGTAADSWNREMGAIDIEGQVNNVTFNNNQIYDAQHDGIFIHECGSNVTFNNTKILGAGVDGQSGSWSSVAHTGAAIRLGTTSPTFNGLEIANVAWKGDNTPYFFTSGSASQMSNVTIHDDDVTYEIPGYPDPVNNQSGGVIDVLEGITGYDVELAGLSWANESGSSVIKEGEKVSFTAAIRNTSNVDIPEGVSIGVKITIDGKGSYSNTSYKGGLKAGETIKLTPTAKWTATAGGHTIVATADHQDKLYAEVTNDNNTRTKSFNVEEVEAITTYTPVTGGYDLVVTDISYGQETIAVGDALTWTATVVNAGDTAVPSGTTIGIQFQVDGNTGNITWCDSYNGGLAPGASVQLTCNGGTSGNTWTASTAGTYEIMGWVDDVNRFASEVNENNNQKTISITVPYGGVQYIENPDYPDDLDNLGEVVIPSTEAPTTTQPVVETPAEVTGLNVTSPSYNTISVVWSSNSDKEAKGQKYNVYVDGVKKLENVASVSYTINDVSAGSHTVKVTATLNGTETTGATATITVAEAPAVASEASVEINGYQISTTVEGFRTVYSVNDPNSEIVKAGMLYGIGNVAESSMVMGTSGVYNFEATEAGKLDAAFSSYEDAQSYSMTMKFSKTAAFYTTKMNVRAYAQLEDGTYIYSTVENFTVYDIADFLFQNLLMNNLEGHDYLYNNILKVVKSDYVYKDFAWNNSIVKPGGYKDPTTEAPATEAPTTVAPTTVAPTTVAPTTEAPTTETPTIVVPDNPSDDEEYEISNVALGKTATASGTTHTYVASNAVDGNVDTYWEGSGNPSTLTVALGADTQVSYIVVKLNPNSAWGARTQTIAVLGHTQDGSTFTEMVSATAYQFDPNTGNQITIQVNGKASDIQLRFDSNTGAGAGQAAEVEVYGVPADNPDLTITNVVTNATSLYENEDLVIGAVVKNKGTKASAATTLTFYKDDVKIDSVDVKALAAGESTTIQINAGNLDAGEYTISAKVDEEGSVIEKSEANNSYEMSGKVTIKEVESVDLVPVVSWVPSNPSQGSQTDFTVQIVNNGNQVTKDSSRVVTVVIKNESGSVVQTLTQTANGTIAVDDNISVSMGKWTVGEGKFTIEATVAADSGELDVKKKNNTVTSSLYVGRGADMPFTVLEAENAKTNGTVLQKNFTLADFAGEASGRSAVKLDQNGQYVEFTLTSAANAFVLRNAVDEGVDGTISLYADGTKVSSFNVTSHFSRVNCSPTSLGDLGFDRGGSLVYWLYEDSQLLLDKTYPAGTKIKIQKDAGDVSWIYVDMIETEEVAPATTNPDPNQYVEVSSSKGIEAALNEARMNSKKGIFIPAGEWEISSMISVYGGAFEILGAGPWHTKLVVPQDRNNTDAGFRINQDAAGSSIKNLSAWGNYTYRQDGPGKFINGDKMENVTVENVWVEHFVCLYWGVGSSNNTFKDCRIKNVFADGINMTNGSNNNVITNCYARATGDDSFALFSAIDNGGDYNVGNRYSNLTAVCPRRAACFAIYGGSDNVYENLYGADTLTYPGITMSSLSFGYQTKGFGDKDCIVENVTLDRCGGDFYTSNGSDDHFNDYQNFGAIWIYAGDRIFQNVVLRNIDINDPVYYGIQIQTMYSGGPASDPMKNVTLENITINNANRQGIKFLVCAEAGQGPCVGTATFRNVQINNAKLGSVYGLDRCPDFTAIKENCNW